MSAALSRRVAEQCRVVVDNDFAGDPDGVLALAHHLLSPSNRVVAITSSFLDPQLVVPPAVSAGAEAPFAGGGRSPAAEAIVAAAREESDLPLYLVCAGPLTNVASALVLDPGIVDRLTLVWVGGSL